MERLVATTKSISQGRWSFVRDFKQSILKEEAGTKHTAALFMFSAHPCIFIICHMTAFLR
jgi:hypothetical protein